MIENDTSRVILQTVPALTIAVYNCNMFIVQVARYQWKEV
jgi:hypothetical protein